MDLTLGDLARIVGGEVVGDPRTPISGAAGITQATTGDITLLSNPRYTPLLRRTAAAAVVVWKGFNHHDIPMIRVSDPEASFARIAARFSGPARHPDWGVHSAACIAESARIGQSVRIGPFVTVMDNASVGDRTVLYPGVYLGAGASVGEDCVLHAGVAVLDRVVVMDRVVIHPGSVLGADGFGYSSSGGRHVKIPHLGSVLVECDVEIGANVTIDRARYDFTVVGSGTKIDNLVHVAHNVKIGPNCLIVAQAGLAGSVSVGEGALLAGQSGVERHVAIGPGARVAGKAGVTRDVPGGATVGGFPAQDKFRWLREEAALRKLPEILSRLRELSERVEALEKEPGDDSRER